MSCSVVFLRWRVRILWGFGWGLRCFPFSQRIPLPHLDSSLFISLGMRAYLVPIVLLAIMCFQGHLPLSLVFARFTLNSSTKPISLGCLFVVFATDFGALNFSRVCTTYFLCHPQAGHAQDRLRLLRQSSPGRERLHTLNLELIQHQQHIETRTSPHTQPLSCTRPT